MPTLLNLPSNAHADSLKVFPTKKDKQEKLL
jgi:hypothetical protein